MAKKSHKPMVEAWYKTENGEVFEVLTADEDETVGIQYLDGSVEELDLEDWDNLVPREISRPREVLAQDYESGDEREAYGFDEMESERDGDWPNALDDDED